MSVEKLPKCITLTSQEYRLNHRIPTSDLESFWEILKTLKTLSRRIDRANFQRKNFATNSAKAVDEVFELINIGSIDLNLMSDSMSARTSFSELKDLKGNQSYEKLLIDFNTLYRETLNLEGLLKISGEICLWLNKDLSEFQQDYERVKKLIEDKEDDQAIEFCVEILDNVEVIENFSLGDINCILEIQYSLGCLYFNRAKGNDLDMALDIFSSYLENAKLIINDNFVTALVVVQQAIHGLGLVFKNKDEYHTAKIYFEKELEILNLIQLKLQKKEIILFDPSDISDKYESCYSVLSRTHEILGNQVEKNFFYGKSVLAENMLNFDLSKEEAKANFVLDLFQKFDFFVKEPELKNAKKRNELETTKNKENQRLDYYKNVKFDIKLAESEIPLKAGEIYTEKVVLFEKKKSLDILINQILNQTSPNDLLCQMNMLGFDPFHFFKTLNERFIKHRDIRSVSQELAFFLWHYLEKIPAHVGLKAF